MIINEINVWKERKLQIAAYEPYTYAFGAKAELHEGDDIMESYAELEKFVDEKIQIETDRWKNPQKVVRQEVNEAMKKYDTPEINPNDIPF